MRNRSLPTSILAAATILLGTLVARAYDATWIEKDAPVSASKLKQLLDEHESRIAALQGSQLGVNPTGTIIAFAGPVTDLTLPPGYLRCDGAMKLRSEYPKLFAAIGTVHGSGDGATSFALPDYRGLFLRGVDHSAGRDGDSAVRAAPNAGANVGDLVGSTQSDEMRLHWHQQLYLGGSVAGGNAIGFTASGTNWRLDVGTLSPMAGRTAEVGGSENRPKNAYVEYLIKY